MGSDDRVVILHLTDLHFGRDQDENELTARNLALTALLNEVASLDDDWKPTVVCVTGDVTNKGRAAEYELAARWIGKLQTALCVPADALFFCPGNHDVDRSRAEKLARPTDAKEADRILGLPIPDHYRKIFQGYSDNCQQLGVPPYFLGANEEYLVGERKLSEVRFVVLNSAWCSKDDFDRGKLWIGLPQIKYLEGQNQLALPSELTKSDPTVVLIHHPREWLHPDECQALGERPNTLDYLARRCHLILSGHTHGEPRYADQIAEAAWYLTGGATYAEAAYFNSFRIIRVQPDRLIYRSHEYDPRLADQKWGIKGGSSTLTIRRQTVQIPRSQGTDRRIPIAEYRDKALLDAKRLIEAKSRILKSSGRLPETIPLDVAVHVHGPRRRFDDRARLVTEPQSQVILPPHQAIRKSRRTLLLGDLGTGKSTIAGTIVESTLGENPQALAFLVPAKQLNLSPNFTLVQLVDEFSRYFSQQIAPEELPLDLRELLNNRVEITIILDALDEIARSRAAALLKQFGTLVDHWPNVQTIATGRPVELAGISYDDWQVASPVPLERNDKARFFQAEAVAEGRTKQQAMELVDQLMARLDTSQVIDSLASTPLTVRILYSRLSGITPENEPSLGDLLCDAVKSRLGVWARMDAKASSTTLFEQAYPDEDSRAALLGRLLLGLGTRTAMAVEEARRQLRGLIESNTAGNCRAITEEALQFFELSGLLTLDPELQVPVQVFLEPLCGYGLVAVWESPEREPAIGPEQWRIVSFAATVLRRYGLLDKFRDRLNVFLKTLMSDKGRVPAGAYIVSESQDVSCAKGFIENLKDLGPRPLTVLADDYPGSSRVIAETLKLAGKEGFDWFFEHYLDPRYPFVFAGSKLTWDVFSEWAALSLGKLDEHEEARLRTMIAPHMEADTHEVSSIIPRLALLIPQAFPVEQQMWFAGMLLGERQFGTQARDKLSGGFSSVEQALVNKVLLRLSEAGYESAAPAAALWLELNVGKPPLGILKAVTKAGTSRGIGNVGNCLADCTARIGTASWNAFLRWSLFDADSHLATGAAIQLYEVGERNLYFLGESLLPGLHEGGYVRRAEDILSELTAEGGRQASLWLARQTASMKGDSLGAHSGHWRLLLQRLPQLGKDGPAVLASCIGSVGPFVLPRYPEVRQLFRDLLTGERGSEYRAVLRSQVHSPDFKTRCGAAAVLATCDPQVDGETLEVAIQSMEDPLEAGWHEWIMFLLGLSFPAAVLVYISSRLPRFTSKARALASYILYRNGIKIERLELEHLLEWFPGIVYTEAVEFRDPSVRQVLVDMLEKNQSVSAAGVLLRYHAEGLPVDLLARCVTLVRPGLLWDPVPLEEQIKKMEDDPEFARAVAQSSGRIVAQGGARPLVDLFREALREESGWQAVVWSFLCDDSRPGGLSETETRGQWLLDYARLCPRHSGAIGQAAQKLLYDPRVVGSPRAEPREWLAILANEFSNLSSEEMEKVLTSGVPIQRSAACALLARVGHVPAGFRKRMAPRGPATVPSFSGPPPGPKAPLADQIRSLKELARQSGRLHPDVCRALGDLMLEDRLTEQDLSELSGEGAYGVLVASALCFVYGEPPRPEYFVPILSLWLGPDERTDQCLQRLGRIWRGFHYGILQEDPAVRERYIRFLDERLSIGGAEVGAIAAELLALRGSLAPTQAQLVLEHDAHNPGYHQLRLNAELGKWLAGDIDVSLQRVLVESLEKGLTLLDGEHWESSYHYALTYLVFALAYWVLTGQTTELSVRIFLLGLKSAFLEQGPLSEGLRADTLAAIEPLLAKAPGAILQDAIVKGRTDGDPVVRTICNLLVLRNPTN